MTLLGAHDELVEVDLPPLRRRGHRRGRRRDAPGRTGQENRRHLVTTVYDLMLAQYGVRRDALPGEWPAGYDDPEPYTPAWQEEITGVDAGRVRRIAREFARNAESEGRSMIIMGAGTNHWYHSDEIYRSMLALVLLCGCQGKNGGGWAHYVGQEKVRPITGWTTIAFAFDWARPTRHMAGTALVPGLQPVALRHLQGRRVRNAPRQGPARRQTHGGLPRDVGTPRLAALFPGLQPQPLEITAEAEREGIDVKDYVVRELKEAACASPPRTRTRRRTSRASSPSGAVICWAPPARVTSSSSSTCSASRTPP